MWKEHRTAAAAAATQCEHIHPPHIFSIMPLKWVFATAVALDAWQRTYSRSHSTSDSNEVETATRNTNKKNKLRTHTLQQRTEIYMSVP